MARFILEEAAALGGGTVLGLPGGELLLGSAKGTAERAAAALGELTSVPLESWALPAGRQALEARCRAAEGPLPASPSIAEAEARCAEAPLAGFAQLTFFARGTNPTPVAQRLHPAPAGLSDPVLEALARELLCRRLLAALADPAGRRELPRLRPGLRLILDIPRAGYGGLGIGGRSAEDAMAPIALLPLAAMAEPSAFANTVSRLRAGGWAVGVSAAGATATGWLTMPEQHLAIPGNGSAPPHPPSRLIILGPAPDWARENGALYEVAA
ncbi:hypothetical protein [Roseococcus sp. YIM B11640]|uniref:hypothetical protein n=1 Tax=Roseococcus sp. YIM B11640 TaxID=3133973 RepID=UPI003C7A2284